MLSPAFGLVSCLEFKITYSDDPHHTALLQTMANFLGEQTFRQKIESYGSFKDGTVWGCDVCLGNCSVQYGGSFKQPIDLAKLHAVDHFKTKHKLASGATGTIVVERC